MLDLTFGEQVKIILSRKGMTIKELAEIIEERTGKKMSRQNLTQRLGRDNFQEQDMRMIAEILECPFHLSILMDNEEVERASKIEDVEPTQKELSKLARAKERKEKKAKEAEKAKLADAMEQVPSEVEQEPSEKEMTLGDYIDIHEELERRESGRLPEAEEVAQMAREQEVINEPEPEPELEFEPEPEAVPEPKTALSDVEQVLRELEEMERENGRSRESRTEQGVQNHQEKKVGGWRAMFQRKTRKEKEEELKEEARIEQEIEEEPVEIDNDYIDYEEPVEEEVAEEPVQVEAEPEEEFVEEEEDEDAEDLTRGDINPYTGHEYESNSVRMHPKRIGYVQVYDRRDHAWTDMTEWAFLGYQERKKALLGRDYEPPIYLD